MDTPVSVTPNDLQAKWRLLGQIESQLIRLSQDKDAVIREIAQLQQQTQPPQEQPTAADPSA